MVAIEHSQIYGSVDDFLLHVGYGLSQNFKDKTMALVPICIDGEVSGCLALFQSKIRPFTTDDLNLLRARLGRRRS